MSTQEKNHRSGKKRRPATLGGILVILWFIVSGLFVVDFGRKRRPSTINTAEAYLAAVLAGDKEGAMGLMRLEPLCSGAGMEEQVDLQITRFANTQVRDVSIDIHDLTGSVAYNPGTQGANIRFEYQRPDNPEWLQGEFGVVIFEHHDDALSSAFRAICWLWTAE